MVPRRWILSSGRNNVSSCIYDCYDSNLPPPRPLSSPTGHRVIVNAFIAAVCVAAAVLFLVLTYYTILVRRRRANPLPSVDQPPSEPDGAVADYHVWHARTVGLNESTISSIPVKPYISGERITADCSVCLGEFRDGELIRLLPGCEHAFHVSCIDTWLRSHINCPLCRAKIVDSSDSCEGGLPPVAAPEGNAPTSRRRVSGDFEEVEGSEIGTMIVSESYLDRGESSIPGESSDFLRSGLQPDWRSKSMDYSLRETDTALLEEKKELEQCYSDDMKKSQRSSSFKEDCQQKFFEEIGGGSSSESGRRFFFTKDGRARSSSVLPL